MKIKYYCENNYDVVDGEVMITEIVSTGSSATMTWKFIKLD